MSPMKVFLGLKIMFFDLNDPTLPYLMSLGRCRKIVNTSETYRNVAKFRLIEGLLVPQSILKVQIVANISTFCISAQYV